MIVRVPYTEVQPATRIALQPYTVQWHEIETDYAQYWRDQWTYGQPFINVEHDVVPWPGALEGLWSCIGAWCAYAYHHGEQHPTSGAGHPPAGCVKIGRGLIEATPSLWDDADGWLDMDGRLARGARAAGIEVCQHFPPVVNANPVVLCHA